MWLRNDEMTSWSPSPGQLPVRRLYHRRGQGREDDLDLDFLLKCGEKADHSMIDS